MIIAQQLSSLILYMKQNSTNGMVPRTIVAKALAEICEYVSELDARIDALEDEI